MEHGFFQNKKMNELDVFLKKRGFVVTIEPIISNYFGNCICEYTNYELCAKIRLIRDRGYLYVFISKIENDKEWYNIINILMSIFKRHRRLFIKQNKESDDTYFYNLISSKDNIQPNLQVNLLKRYYVEVMSIFQDKNMQSLSKIESEKIDIEKFVKTS